MTWVDIAVGLVVFLALSLFAGWVGGVWLGRVQRHYPPMDEDE